jgi:RNA polymerase sigma-70 factor (ECF subfamily)
MNFPTTHWSVLALATVNGDPAGRAALARLCQAYWRPIADFLEYRGLNRADAEDMTQEFFQALLLSRGWQRADRVQGKFRSFLLGSLMRVLARERERKLTQKRGSGEILLSLDEMTDSGQDPVGDDDELTRCFDQAWATEIMDAAMQDLASNWEQVGKANELDVLLAFLPAGVPLLSYEEAAKRLGISLSAVKVRILRLRQQYRERLEAQVARTVSAPHEIAGEMAHLFHVLADPSWSGAIPGATPAAFSAEKPI